MFWRHLFLLSGYEILIKYNVNILQQFYDRLEHLDTNSIKGSHPRKDLKYL